MADEQQQPPQDAEAPTPKRARASKKTAPKADKPAAPPPPIDSTGADDDAPRGAGFDRADAPPPEDAAGSTLPPECPVIALGREQGVFHFLTIGGEILSLSKRDISNGGQIAALFDGHTDWLRKVFPDWGRRSLESVREAEARGFLAPSFVVADARDYFMRECARLGVRNPYADLRSTGTWRAENGDLILHLGDAIWRVAADNGGITENKPGGYFDGHLYVAKAAEPKPADEVATANDVRELLHALKQWNWRAPRLAPRVLLGFIMQGYLVGALEHRAHIWVKALKGSGKSTLERLLRRAFGKLAARAANPTEAHVRQKLDGAARPVLVDEIENSEMSRRASQVVELARLASSEDQAGAGYGSADGKAVTYEMKVAFYLTSIIHPPMKPQDASRFTFLDMLPLPDDPTRLGRRAIAGAIARMRVVGPKLFALALHLWPDIPGLVEKYDRALGGLGRDARVSDQLGTLLALSHAALGEDDDQKAIDDLVRGLDIDVVIERPEDEGEQQQCMSVLLTHSADYWDGGAKRTLAGLIEMALNADPEQQLAKTAAEKVIQAYGLRVEAELYTEGQLEADADLEQVEGPWLVVAHSAQGLNTVFRGTRWADGAWNQIVPFVPGARTNGRRAVRMAGINRKGFWVPVRPLLDGTIWERGFVWPQGDAPLAPPDPPQSGDDRAGYGGGYGDGYAPGYGDPRGKSNASDTS